MVARPPASPASTPRLARTRLVRAPQGGRAAEAPPREAAIQVMALTKRYASTTAVDGISFEVPRGGVTGFIGPNGAGKTTTIRMLLGLVQPTSGTATVLGHPITRPRSYLPRVGALIEAPAFYPQLSGARNLRALAVLGGFSTDRIPRLLAQVGLGDRGQDSYKMYSLGMKQRLGIAAALLPDPELVILDEPTNGLDPGGIHEVRDFLRGLGDAGKTVFVSSHLLSEIQKMCDHLIVVRKGRLLYQGGLEGLVRKQGLVVVAEDRTRHAALADLLRKAGHPVEAKDGTLHVHAGPEASADINRRAMAAGIVLCELRPSTKDLEETILRMTGRGAP
ncbi:MAG TPA: ABC transporter ATP-binding protein [Candidatus Thermoplasmatota archaeon]|nr:ABC transporter ATP-binding protein [Candidatus Thermoplasmatota archaeon]